MAKTLVYQMCPYTWENNGNGNNILKNMSKHLKRVKALDVDYVWLSPIYPSPISDIDDYKKMDSFLGSYADLVKFINKAHSLGMKVIFSLDLGYAAKKWLYPNNTIDIDLMHELQKVVDFWKDLYHVDGFCITQCPTQVLSYERQIDAIDAVFSGGRENLFIVMECCDSTDGNTIEYCYCEASVTDYILETSLKAEIDESYEKFRKKLKNFCNYPIFMLSLEDHNSLRFLARCELDPEDVIWEMFNSGAEAVCLYQGQELCMGAKSRKKSGPHEPISLEEYRRQEDNPSSYLNLIKIWIRRWKGE